MLRYLCVLVLVVLMFKRWRSLAYVKSGQRHVRGRSEVLIGQTRTGRLEDYCCVS